MIEGINAEWLAGEWTLAVLRLLFVGLIYLFLFLVLRTTARELVEIARGTNNAGPGGMRQASLVVEDGEGSTLVRGQALFLPWRATIGRGDDCEIVIDDPHVSARHAEIWHERGQWWLRDLRSSNGTEINGEAVRTVVAIRHGDVLQCGRVRLRLESVGRRTF